MRFANGTFDSKFLKYEPPFEMRQVKFRVTRASEDWNKGKSPLNKVWKQVMK
jgi:hypothetical protein